MESAATAIAQFLNIPIEVSRVSLDRFSEAGARAARYQAFDTIRAKGEWILTGHTSDDQAETVLANLLRGAGLDGLAGIPQRRGHVARPLLEVSRSETRELATLAELPWTDDPANLDEGPLRNRIRRELIPRLEAEYNPGLRHHLVSAAQAISELTSRRDSIGERTATGWRAPAAVLWAMGRSQATDAIRRTARELSTGYGFDRAAGERVWAVVVGETGATEVGGDIRVVRSGPWIEIVSKRV